MEWILWGSTLVASLLLHCLRRSLLKKLEKEEQFWSYAFVKSLYYPMQTFLAAILIALSLQLASHYVPLTPYILPLLKQGVIPLLLLWFLLRFLREGEKSLRHPSHHMDPTTLKATGQFLRIVILLLGVLMILQSFGIPLAGVLAFGGIGGIAVGFAAKDLLSNFFGGLMLFLDRPFKLGEMIRASPPTFEGIVEQIGWRYTRIRTLDRTPLFIPNSIFSTISLENLSRMQNRKIREFIGLRYEDADKLPTLIKELNHLLKTSPLIDPAKISFARLVHFGPSALEILLHAYTHTTEWNEFQKEQEVILLQILDLFQRQGARPAYPITTLQLEKPVGTV